MKSDLPPSRGALASRRSRVAKIICAISGVMVTIAGCKVGPDYHPPAQSTPPHWESPPTTQASVTVQQPVEVERWWTAFDDPELNSLIHRAALSNLDVQIRTERIRQARYNITAVRANLFPFVNGSAGESRTFSAAPPFNSWRAGLDASWELDIFGGTRRAIESATANYQAQIEDRRDVLVTLLGEVATDYITVRGLQQQILQEQRSIEIAQRTANIARDKKRLGTNTDLDIAQADSQVVSEQVTITDLKTSLQRTIYSIGILLGLPPTDLNTELAAVGEIPPPPAELPVGLPSELLRRRPDIRRAERVLASENAQIGVAVARLFPQFSLTGSTGFSSNRLQSLANWNSRSLSFGPSVSTPLFDAGQIFANIDIQKSLTAESLLTYRQAVLNALLEVQNALVAFADEQQRRVLLAQNVQLSARALDIATRRYSQGGLTDFTTVLTEERALFAAQNSLIVSSENLGVDAVAVYKALGGGWDIAELASPRDHTPPLPTTQSDWPVSQPSPTAPPTTLPRSPVSTQAVVQPVDVQPVVASPSATAPAVVQPTVVAPPIVPAPSATPIPQSPPSPPAPTLVPAPPPPQTFPQTGDFSNPTEFDSTRTHPVKP